MAVRPVRAVRMVLCGVLVGALVAGALSAGSVPVATADGSGGSVGPSPAGSVLTSDSVASTPPLQTQSNETGTDGRMLEGFDRVETRIDLSENGSASVTVLYRYLLTNNESTREWETLRSDVRENPGAYVAAERARWNATVEAARNETGRSMSLTGFAVRTDEGMTPREYGDVVFTFRWSSFATVEPKWIGAGDALEQYALEDGTTLRISWPASYSLQSATPKPDDDGRTNVVGWRGEETDFLEDEPRIELLQNESMPQPDPPDDEPSNRPSALLVGVFLVLALVVGATWWLRWNGGWAPVTDDDEPPSEADEPAATRPPPDLLSNEERVLRLLEHNGGRMKQQAVVTELDWTEAKTSQVVGGLRDDGSIEVFRIGRENVLALPEYAGDRNGEDHAGDPSVDE